MFIIVMNVKNIEIIYNVIFKSIKVIKNLKSIFTLFLRK